MKTPLLCTTSQVTPREGTRPTSTCRPGPLTRRRRFGAFCITPRGSFPFQIMAWIAASFASALAAGVAGQNPIAERVADRTAVERVYYDHRLGTKPPFELALPTTEVERLVKADLHKEALLARVYHVEVTSPQIVAEVKRIDRETRAPEMLAEIKAALGNDPARFARAVAKPIVVDRELRRRFENDDGLHRAQRKQVEAVREQIFALQRKENPWAAVLNAMKESTVGTVSEVKWQLGPRSAEAQSPDPKSPVETPLLVKARSSKYSLNATATFAQALTPVEPPSEPEDKSWFENLSSELRNVLRAQLQQPGDVSAVIETPNGFLLFVANDKTDKSLSAAVLSVSKISFEQWLSEQKE